MAFEAFENKGQHDQLVKERTSRLQSSPIGCFCYVTVTFPSAYSDIPIPHTLPLAGDPNLVRWLAVGQEFDGSIFRSPDAGRRQFVPGLIYLQSTEIGTARLLLFLEA